MPQWPRTQDLGRRATADRNSSSNQERSVELIMARKTPFTVSVDLDANAAYIKMTSREVAKSVEAGSGVLVDLDELGVVVGIEVLSIDAEIPYSRLITDFHVHRDDVEILRMLRPSVRASIMRSNDGTSRQDELEGSLASSLQ